MSKPEVELEVGGVIHRGWHSVDVRRSIHTIAGSFDLSLSSVWQDIPESFKLTPGEKGVLSIHGTPVITGYIDRVETHLDASSHKISVSGRDASSVLVDCSSLCKKRVMQG